MSVQTRTKCTSHVPRKRDTPAHRRPFPNLYVRALMAQFISFCCAPRPTGPARGRR